MWTEWLQLYHTNCEDLKCSAVTPPPETDSFEVLNDPLEDPDLLSQIVFSHFSLKIMKVSLKKPN